MIPRREEGLSRMGGSQRPGELGATSGNIQQVEKSRVFSKVEKISWDGLPDDVVSRITDCDLLLDSDMSLGWTLNDISTYLFRGELPPGLNKESLINLIRSAEEI